MRVTVYDGKYTVIQDERGGLRALRYGEEWRDCTGDGLILALAQEVEELRSEVTKFREANKLYRPAPSREDPPQYVCPICSSTDKRCYTRCDHPACPDGRDQ
jgi:hypothetical protein